MGVYTDVVASVEKQLDGSFNVLGTFEAINSFKKLNNAIDYLWELRETFL
jgi:hypothetical protein